MAVQKMLCGGEMSSAPEIYTNTQGSALSSFSFSDKAGKKLFITLVMAWSSGVDSDYSKIDTSTLSGGTILNTYSLNLAGVTGNNAYYTARCYEIDVTSNSLSFSLVKSSSTYSAIFV